MDADISGLLCRRMQHRLLCLPTLSADLLHKKLCQWILAQLFCYKCIISGGLFLLAVDVFKKGLDCGFELGVDAAHEVFGGVGYLDIGFKLLVFEE